MLVTATARDAAIPVHLDRRRAVVGVDEGAVVDRQIEERAVESAQPRQDDVIRGVSLEFRSAERVRVSAQRIELGPQVGGTVAGERRILEGQLRRVVCVNAVGRRVLDHGSSAGTES